MNKLSLRPNFEVCLKETITFSNGELVLNEEARITPIVLEVGMTQEEVDKCRVKQVLVNKGATKNILYFKYFKEIEMNDNHLKPSNMVLKGFSAHKISVKGTVRVHVTIDTDNCTQEEELKFYVVDIDSPYCYTWDPDQRSLRARHLHVTPTSEIFHQKWSRMCEEQLQEPT